MMRYKQVALKTSPFLKGFLLRCIGLNRSSMRACLLYYSGLATPCKGPLQLGRLSSCGQPMQLRRFFHEVKKKNLFLEVHKLTIFVLLFFCISNIGVCTLQAQVRSLKLGIGPELSMNMLLPDEANQNMSLGGGINITYGAFPYFGVGVICGFNELSGVMKDELTFITSSWHLKTNMVYNMFPYSKVNPFISAGIGLLYFDPKYDNGKPLPHISAGDYHKWTAVIPISVGINFFFAEEFSVNITGEYNIAMSSYLDDIKTDSNDKYYSLKLGFSYYFFDKFYILWERDRK